MKKPLLLLALAVGLASTAHAQSIKYGVKAGASLTNLTGGGSDETDYKVGFHAGLVANFAVNDIFSIQPELLYSQKGAKAQDDVLSSGGLPANSSIKAKFNYIDIPVLAHINAGGLFFELGPQIGFLAAAHSVLEANGQSFSMDVKDQVTSVDFGYAGGLGYQLPAGPGIGLRYNGGFTNLVKDGGANDKAHNSAFQLYLTYMFGSK